MGKNIKQTDYNLTDIKDSLFNLLINMTNKMFSYEGLPEEIDQYEIEKTLFLQGKAVFWKLGGHYFCTTLAKGGVLDAYGRLVEATPITFDGNIYPTVRVRDKVDYDRKTGNFEIQEKNAVLIKNNLEEISTLAFLNPFLERINYIWNTIGIEESNIRSKRIFTCLENQRPVVDREISNLINGKKPYALVTDKAMIDSFQELKRAVDPNCLKDLWYDYDKVWSLIMQFLGINTLADSSKKERLISAEVEANNEMIALFKAAMLEFRQHAMDQVNEMFGLNIKVWSYDFHKEMEINQELEEKGMLNLQNEQIEQEETKEA